MGWRGVALAVTLGACTHPALPPLPSAGGPAWHQLTSEHFTVWTDADVDDAGELVRDLEHLRQVVFGVAFPDTRSTAKSLVIALRDDDEVHAFVPREFVAMTWDYGNPMRTPVIVLPVDTTTAGKHVVAHELTHLVSFQVLPVQPRWFAEGLATYFESVELSAKETDAKVGVIDRGRALTIRGQGLAPLADVLACDRTACLDGRFYATVSAWFGFLANEHPAELVRYMELIADRPKEQQAAAYAEAFPALPPGEADHALAHWVAYGKHVVRSYHVAVRPTPFAVAPLGDADALAARALLAAMLRLPVAATLTAEVLAKDPTHVVANSIHVRAGGALPIATAHAITAAHPDDWRAWLLVGEATGATAEDRAEARTRACARLAVDPAAPGAIRPGFCPP